MNRRFLYPWIIGFKGLSTILIVFLLSVAGAHAQIPRQLSYYGFLSDTAGKPLVGQQALTFRLYDDPGAGKVVWEETHQINVNTGVFQVLLGASRPLEISFDRPLWMAIEVNQEGEMKPRLPLVSVVYALNAAALDSIPATHFLRVDRGGEIQGPLSINGTLIVGGKPAMIWNQYFTLMVALVSFACGALGGVFVFTLARQLSRKNVA